MASLFLCHKDSKLLKYMTTQNAISDAPKSLREAEAEALKKVKQIQDAIAAIEGTKSTSDNTIEYDAAWSPSRKFAYLLKTQKRFLHFRQAAELVVKIEGKGDVKEWTSKFSTGTGPLKQNETIVKVQAGASNQDTFWGSPKWLTDNGAIKDGYQFDEKYLSTYKEQDSLFDL
jgi:hypothetical protein